MVIAVSGEPSLSPGLVEPECQVARVESLSIRPETSHVIREGGGIIAFEQRRLTDKFRTVRVVEDDVSVAKSEFWPSCVRFNILEDGPVDVPVDGDIHGTEMRDAITQRVVLARGESRLNVCMQGTKRYL